MIEKKDNQRVGTSLAGVLAQMRDISWQVSWLYHDCLIEAHTS